MLSLEEIKKFYPETLHGFERFLLREYLQYKILEIVFESPFGSKLSFLGGTCLRIVHNNNRFSEDLDFDNFDLSRENFEAISGLIEQELTRQGFEVEIRNVFKGAFHCHVKFPNLLFESRLSGHREEKILIQLDTEPQYFEFQPEKHIVNKFDVLINILTTPIDILLSQKLYAICNRPRPKGRDFFDVSFLIPRTKPNYDYLNQKMGVANAEALKETILEACKKIDFEFMVNDVRAFLFSARDEKRIRLFMEYFEQVEL
ncbi:MAG: nucleotidyl transferase AbiEii/AbiGii toxin family protein [Phaeodactylibacter sp.]|nr:nucleotidyl transferase AbiEii/AbiGii toxin family protein [Phaeodactylibacter sp.]MCB9050854.1 nucleotidyl transferase AbiEii/AbiGii toxin family protein [Lewinellaceae bacterium]